jgi:hypothetical protein
MVKDDSHKVGASCGKQHAKAPAAEKSVKKDAKPAKSAKPGRKEK